MIWEHFLPWLFLEYLESPLNITEVSQAHLAHAHGAAFSLLYVGESYGNIPHGKGKHYYCHFQAICSEHHSKCFELWWLTFLQFRWMDVQFRWSGDSWTAVCGPIRTWTTFRRRRWILRSNASRPPGQLLQRRFCLSMGHIDFCIFSCCLFSMMIRSMVLASLSMMANGAPPLMASGSTTFRMGSAYKA